MPQLPEGWQLVESGGKPVTASSYSVPFKDGWRPATREEYERYQRRSKDPAFQALDAGLATTGALAFAAPMLPVGVASAMASPKAAAAMGVGRAALGMAGGESVPGALWEGAQTAGSLWGAPKVLGKIAGFLTRAARGGSAAAKASSTAAPIVAAETKVATAVAKVAQAPKATPPAVAAGESSTLEQQLAQTVKLTKGQKSQLANAQNLEARIVDWKTRQGFSNAQIENILLETYGHGTKTSATGMLPKQAREIVEMVLKHHGLK